jgi:hypothetical protein
MILFIHSLMNKKKSWPNYLPYFFLSKLETFAGRGAPEK